MSTDQIHLSAAPLIEEVLDSAIEASRDPQRKIQPIHLHMGGFSIRCPHLVSWDRGTGVLVCRGGEGYKTDDMHYIRVACLQSITLGAAAQFHVAESHAPSAPAGQTVSRLELESLIGDIKESIRAAAGYPVSIVARAETLGDGPQERAAYGAWLTAIREAISHVCEHEAHRHSLQARVSQIVLRRGAAPARLNGSVLTMEAEPTSVPSSADLQSAIVRLL